MEKIPLKINARQRIVKVLYQHVGRITPGQGDDARHALVFGEQQNKTATEVAASLVR
jgi:hypothetical protein